MYFAVIEGSNVYITGCILNIYNLWFLLRQKTQHSWKKSNFKAVKLNNLRQIKTYLHIYTLN